MAAAVRHLPPVCKPRGISRRKQRGYILVGAMRAILSTRRAKAFTVNNLFAAAEPGFHAETYDPTTLLARVNLLTWSEDISNAAWAKNFSAGKDAVVTPNFGVAPDGTLTASRVQLPACTGGEFSRVFQTFNTKGAATGSAQIRIKGVSAGGTLQISFLTGFGAVGTQTIVFTSTEWNTFTLDSKAINPASENFYIGFHALGGPWAAVDFLLDCGQVNAGGPAAYQKVTDWNTEYLAAALNSVAMWQDTSGQLPVTAVEQPVGAWLDTHLGLALSAELVTVAADRDFSADTGFYTKDAGVTISGGTANWAAVAATFQLYRLAFLTVGKCYEVTYTVSAYTAGGIRVTCGTGSVGTTRQAVGTYTQRLVCAATSTLAFQSVGASTTLSIDNVSIKEVTGNHAMQATGGSRPLLSALYNRLTKTEQFDDVAWNKQSATVVANATIAPDGQTTADLVYPSVTGSYTGNVFRSPGVASLRKFVIHAKAAGMNWLQVVNGAGSAGAVWFNLGAGTVGTQVANYTGSMVVLGNGWYRCTVVSSAADFAALQLGPCDADNTGTATTSGTNGVYLWGSDLRSGNDATLNQPAYQRVNTATDYDSAGFIHYLKFDGTDDSFVTPSIDFSGVNKMTVWTAATKLADAATAVIAELGGGGGNGSFYVALNGGASNFVFDTFGTVTHTTGAITPLPAPKVAVLTTQHDTGAVTQATQLALRMDGLATALTYSTGPTSAGNFANAPVYIGRRNNASLPFNGRLTSLTVRGSTTPSSVAFIAAMEQYAAARAGQAFVST